VTRSVTGCIPTRSVGTIAETTGTWWDPLQSGSICCSALLLLIFLPRGADDINRDLGEGIPTKEEPNQEQAPLVTWDGATFDFSK
jgi:hypothetical protein